MERGPLGFCTIAWQPASRNEEEDNYNDKGSAQSNSAEAANGTVGIARSRRGNEDRLYEWSLFIRRHGGVPHNASSSSALWIVYGSRCLHFEV